MKLPILRKLHLSEHKSHLSSAHMPGLMPIRSGQILYNFTSSIFILLKNSHSVPYLFLPCFHCKYDIGIASLRTIIQRLETLAISSVLLSQNIYLTQGPNINCMCSTSTNVTLSLHSKEWFKKFSSSSLLPQFTVSSGALAVKLVVKIANMHWALVPLL